MHGFAMEFDAQTRAFVRREITAAPLQSGELLIRVTLCTICGSDLHTFHGRRSAPPGCVLGHEIIGEVVAWEGDEPPRDYHGHVLKPGQRVTWAMAVGCGDCFYCRHNLTQKCERLFKYGHQTKPHGGPSGGLSPFCVLVPGTPVFPIPDSLSDEVACPANCATATVSAALRLIAETHALPGATVFITGAGMLGLTAAAQLSDAAAKHIVMADLDADRLQTARAFGATHGVSAGDAPGIRGLLAQLTQGRGADIALDFAGATAAVQTCIDTVRVGGCVLLAGSVFPTDALSLSPEQVVRRMLTLRGLHNYQAGDLAQGLRFLERMHSRFPFQQLVSRVFPLEQTQQAFEYAGQQRPVRLAVRP